MSAVMKQRAWLALVAVFAVLLALLSPTSAHANGPIVTLSHDRAQAGDVIEVSSNSGCPVSLPPFYSEYRVDVQFTDSSNATYNALQIATIPAQANTNWGSGVFMIPEDATQGVASVKVWCMRKVASQWVASQFYDSVNLTVVGEASSIVVDKTNLWSTATFSSVTPCPAESVVDVEIRSRAIDQNATPTRSITEISSRVSTDTSGNWTYAVDLYPGNGFIDYPDYVDPVLSLENEYYSLWARCASVGVEYQYDSFSFEVVRDEYVALGDSFSAGTGTFNYDLQACFRSTDSYPYYLVEHVGMSLPNFGACHGSVTDDIFSSIDGPAQSWRLSEDTKYVTLTIGGNDVGFSKVIKDCVDYFTNSGYSCSAGTSLASDVNTRLDALSDPNVTAFTLAPDDNPSATYQIHTIRDTLELIADSAPNAEIYIAGYPYLFGASSVNYTYDGNAPGAHKCVVYDGVVDIGIAFWDAEWMNDKADELNGIINDAVEDMQANGETVTYVSPVNFNGHGLCDSSTPWINPIDLTWPTAQPPQPTPESMHPTVTGYQEGYGPAFEDAMN